MRAGPRGPVRILSRTSGGVAALMLATTAAVFPTSPAHAQSAAVPLYSAGVHGVSDFYAVRSGRPLWFAQQGRQVAVLLDLLRSAEADGLDPGKYHVDDLEKVVRRASSSNSKRATIRADQMLSQALTDYVRDLRSPVDVGIMYVDPELKMTAAVAAHHPRSCVQGAIARTICCRDAVDEPALRSVATSPGQRFVHA